MCRSLLLLVAVWLAGLLVWQLPGAARLEREVGLPWLFARRGPLPVPQEVLVVAIDGASAARLRLPERFADWPRRVYAALIERLAAAGARVIAVDVFFANARHADDDAALAAAIARAGNVVLFGQLQRQVQALPGASADGQVLVDRLRRPYRPFAEAALAVAPFVLPKSPTRVDTVWTHHPAVPTVPTLPAAALLAQAGAVQCPVTGSAPTVQRAACKLLAGSRERMLNFYGPPRTLNIISAADVLRGPLPDVSGRVVFIGHTEPYFPDQQDSFLTAVSRPDGLDLSGVEIAATAYLNLLHDECLRSVAPPMLAGGLLVSALLLSGLYVSLRRPMPVLLSTALVGGLVALCVVTAFARFRLWLPLAPWLAQIGVALAATLVVLARDSGRERARVAQAFRPYLPAHVVERVMRDGDALPVGARASPMRAVCLVSDATGYTALAEWLPAQDLHELVNAYYATLLAPLRAGGGIVTDIVGDSALAVWPLERVDLAARQRACRAAVGIQEALTALPLPRGGLPTRVGLHVGEVLLGPVGALDHYEYRAIGDAVNTASRIEQLNKWLGTRVLASEAVVRGLLGVDYRRVGCFRLAGKSEALAIYELLSTPYAAQRQFAAALEALAGGDLRSARRLFHAVLAVDANDPVAAFYVGVIDRHVDMLGAEGIISMPK
ncbi:MAG: CHASE2 domain-containing protein [Immundisolibacter sp.]